MSERIELTTKQIRKLSKGKEVSLGNYIIAPKATSYKDMVEELKIKVYRLRYQLKKEKTTKKWGDEYEIAHYIQTTRKRIL